MKLARLLHEGRPRAARVLDGTVGILDRDLCDLLADPDAGTIVAEAPLTPEALLAPLAAPDRQIFCTGWNYFDHFEESRLLRENQKLDRPDVPTFFSRPPTSVIGPFDAIGWDPEISDRWDYEAELALMIGRGGRSIPVDRALDHVFGYFLANDVSQRDLQKAHGGQWLKGKGIDGTLPLGPWLVTADEFEPDAARIDCLLNGETVQSAAIAQMAFGIAELIASLSRGMTLRPGDILLTGTPAGVGQSRTPPLFLGEGDVLETRGSGLGALRNPIVRADLHSPAPGAVAEFERTAS